MKIVAVLIQKNERSEIASTLWFSCRFSLIFLYSTCIFFLMSRSWIFRLSNLFLSFWKFDLQRIKFFSKNNFSINSRKLIKRSDFSLNYNFFVRFKVEIFSLVIYKNYYYTNCLDFLIRSFCYFFQRKMYDCVIVTSGDALVLWNPTSLEWSWGWTINVQFG